MHYQCSENKVVDQLRNLLISFVITTKLICAFGFAYADCWFSHEAAHMFFRRILKISLGSNGVQPPEGIEWTKKCISDKLQFHCLTCNALIEYHLSGGGGGGGGGGEAPYI